MGSTIQLLKQKTIALIAQRISKAAAVLAVRAWEPATVVEVDVYLPGVDMRKWDRAQHIKLAVAPGIYRDYTPFGWDADTATCTLIVHTGHDGAGARWAQSLQPGDIFSYVGIGPTPHKTITQPHLVFMGDESSLAHFNALRQLAPATVSVSGAVAFEQPPHQQTFAEYCYELRNVAPVAKSGQQGVGAILEWAAAQSFHQDAVFYLAGHIPAVVQLKQWLKTKGYSSGQVKAQGFWK